MGLWQHLKYPNWIIADFFADLKFQREVAINAEAALSSHGPSFDIDVSIHIRLGDYLTLPNSCHLPLGEKYYSDIIAELLMQQPARRFYIFSDDIEAIRGSWFQKMPVVFMGGYPGQTAYTDLFAMSRFKTMIISASTYGWWAGNLSNPGTTVYYPKPWVRPKFAEDPKFSPYVPDEWLPQDTSGHDILMAVPLSGRQRWGL